MASWLQNIGKQVGNAIDFYGKKAGNIVPEWGISERLNPVKQAYASPAKQPYYPNKEGVANLNALRSQILSGGGGRGLPSSIPTGGQPTGGGGGGPSGQDIINSNQQNAEDQLNQDYEMTMGSLASQESGMQRQAGTAESVINTGAGDVRNQIQNTQGTAEQAQQTNLSTATQGATTEMQQARDLFRQTQQSNNAQLSALGISSSSVAEALAERLGVETARRIAGVTGGLQEVRRNVTTELGRIKTYYQGQLTTLEQKVADQKGQIQNALMSGLEQINSARRQAASVKSQQRASLLTQVQTALGSLAQQQQQWQQQLDQWASQKSAALTPLTTNEGLNSVLANWQNTLNANSGITSGQISANMSINAKGQPTYQFGTIKPDKKTAAYTDPITGQGYDENGQPI